MSSACGAQAARPRKRPSPHHLVGHDPSSPAGAPAEARPRKRPSSHGKRRVLQQPKCWNPTDAAPVLLSQLALLEQVSLPQGGDAVEVRLGLLVKNDEAYQQRCASHLSSLLLRSPQPLVPHSLALNISVAIDS